MSWVISGRQEPNQTHSDGQTLRSLSRYIPSFLPSWLPLLGTLVARHWRGDGASCSSRWSWPRPARPGGRVGPHDLDAWEESLQGLAQRRRT